MKLYEFDQQMQFYTHVIQQAFQDALRQSEVLSQLPVISSFEQIHYW